MHFSPVTLGETLQTVCIGGSFVVTDTIHARGLALGRHAHKNAAASVILYGLLRQSSGRAELDCGQGDVIIEPAEQEHASDFPVNTRTLILEFDGETVFAKNARAVSRLGYRLSRSVELRTLMLQIANAMAQPFAADREHLQSLAFEAAASLAGMQVALDNQTLTAVFEAVRADINEQIDLEDIAAVLDLNAAYICRLFKKATGLTVGAYRRGLRIRSAMRALRRSGIPLASVAAASGFCDQSHFGRVFRAHTGLSPAAYRALSQRSTAF